jgi:hypothetical protein
MFSIPNLQQALVKAFMDIAGYNDSAHPAVRLVDMYITDHPEILTYSKYIVLWAVLNVLTALFTLYVGLKLISFAIWLLACASVRAWDMVFRTVFSIRGQMKRIVGYVENMEGSSKQEKDRQVVDLEREQAKGIKGNIEKSSGQDISYPPQGVPACATGALPKQQVAVTAAVDSRVQKRSVIYEWDTSEDEAGIISSY